MIDQQPDLDRLVERLADEPVLAVDCEMDSMYAYGTSLCVVQIGWPGGDALIDGLASLEHSGLGTLFADPGRVKVLHGGENDVGLLRDRWGLHFDAVFDTMIASQVLGREGCGLAAVLERHFGVKLSKKYQKADWRVRPLPDEQAEYARLDVRYLIPLREELLSELQEFERVEEAESDFARVARACIPERPFDPENWGRVKGARDLPPARRGVLKALYSARDQIAKDLDRAPYRVMHDSTLLDLAVRAPITPEAFKRVRGTNRHLRAAELQLLLDAVREGLDLTELALPKGGGRRRPWEGGGERMDPEQESRLKLLRNWRTKRAKSRGVDVSRIATTALLTAIARAAPTDLPSLKKVDGMEDWRLREYGEDLLAALTKPAS